MTRALPLICICSFLLAGCPQTTPKPNGKPRGPDVAALDKSLELPPTDASVRALGQLKQLAAKGNLRARWSRLRYLFELYDFARLTGMHKSRRLLLRALGGTGQERRGAAATRLVLDGLVTALAAHVQTRAAPGR